MCFQYHVNQHSILYDNLKNKNITTLFKQIQNAMQIIGLGKCDTLSMIIHMTTSVSQKLHILCKMLKFIASFMLTLFAQLYERVDILFKRGKHVDDRITLFKQIQNAMQIIGLGKCDTLSMTAHVFLAWYRHFTKVW
jgi:tRNA threonylcarbamoyladenosine modification (KEOPS) complex Cgi121 subunit